MGKRSQRRPVRYDKDQAGCMWGLISIFDFRHGGGTTRKLISDRRRGSRHADGTGISKSKRLMLTDLDEKCQGTDDGDESTIAIADAGKPSVKKLIEEEMFSEQDPKKQIGSTEVEPKQSESETGGHIKKNRKRIHKPRKKTTDILIRDVNSAEKLGSENSRHQNSEQHSLNNLNIDDIMEELCNQIDQKSICVEHDKPGEVHIQSNQKDSDFEEKLSEATKVLINQKFVKREHHTEDGKMHHSKELTDALQTLISNKELFLKLLQDPNSLLVKHIQNLQDAWVEKEKTLTKSNFPKQELSNSRQLKELVNHKQRKFFRRKMKSQERTPPKEIESSPPSNKIVILKPGPRRNSETETSLSSPLQSHYIIRNNGLGERVSSHFSFTEIRRKLKHAMGKERHGISPDGILHRTPYEHQNLGGDIKGVGGENVGRISPSKNHFYTERIPKPSIGIKRGDKTGKTENCEISAEHEIDDYSKERVSNIYIEAKKHLSEILNNGDEDDDFTSRQVPKTLGRILSLPEYNFSPLCSPGRDWEHGFVTAQMRLSTHDKSWRVSENTSLLKQENNVNHIGPSMQNLETPSCISVDNTDDKAEGPTSNPNISDKVIPDNVEEETFCSVRDAMSSQGDVEDVKTDTVFQEENNILDVSPKQSSSSITEDDQHSDTAEICDAKGYSECCKPDSFQENQPPSSPFSSPSSTSLTMKVEDLEKATDRGGRPSPISVLEPLFTEDDISPSSTITPFSEPPIPPLRIQFEEQDSSAIDQYTCEKACMDDKQSIFEYVKAVLKASGLYWDELFMKSLSSDQLLDLSLVDEAEFLSNQLCYDQKLLFDCINEVLMEVCERYFSCSQWVSFVKPNIRPVPNMENAIREVWEGVEWHLLPQLPPHTLDQIVRKDLAKTGKWMDLKFDAESIGVEMAEVIINELMEDTILSCMDESSESEFSALSAELKENESGSSSINL